MTTPILFVTSSHVIHRFVQVINWSMNYLNKVMLCSVMVSIYHKICWKLSEHVCPVYLWDLTYIFVYFVELTIFLKLLLNIKRDICARIANLILRFFRIPLITALSFSFWNQLSGIFDEIQNQSVTSNIKFFSSQMDVVWHNVFHQFH